MKGPEDGVMVQGGREDMTGILFSGQKSLDEDIQRICCIMREDDIIRRICLKEGRGLSRACVT